MSAPIDQTIWCTAFAAASNESSERTPEQCVDRADRAVARFRALPPEWRFRPPPPPSDPERKPSADLSETALRFIKDLLESENMSGALGSQGTLGLIKNIVEAVYR